MPTQQPVWRFLANLGDENPLEYGGYFIYEDTTGVYEPEGAIVEPLVNGKYIVYRFSLDRLKKVGPYLVALKWNMSWGKGLLKDTSPGVFDWTPDQEALEIIAAQRYDEWFHKDLPQVASSIGMDPEELRNAFTSADPIVRAHAYREIGEHFGMENLDSYPARYSKRRIKELYRKEFKA